MPQLPWPIAQPEQEIERRPAGGRIDKVPIVYSSPRWSALYLLCWLSVGVGVGAQVAEPVSAIYTNNNSVYSALFESFPPPHLETLEGLLERAAVDVCEYCILTNAAAHAHSTNRILSNDNRTELMLEPAYLPGTTYWVNDYLHVGHVHYDIALLAVLQAVKVDRIVLQRASCHGSLCAGVGTVDSFYKGYWTALLAAAGQLNVPVYIRFSFREKHVIPLYFSLESEDYFDSTRMHTKPSSTPILLHNWMVFERLVRRSELHYGSIGAVSAEAVQLFKKAAYSLIRPQPQEPHITTQPQPPQAPQTSLPLRTYFEAEGPFKILISYRGPQATRHMANMELLVGKLQRALPPPLYALRLLNSSDPLLTFQTQLQAVAESHVVICNHGAFEANMIYMRNGSLLLEVFGEYGNNEVHTFQRLAVMFGLLYERVNIRSLGDHQTKDFNVTDAEAEGIVGVLERYFLNKPYLRNLAS